VHVLSIPPQQPIQREVKMHVQGQMKILSNENNRKLIPDTSPFQTQLRAVLKYEGNAKTKYFAINA
jgi:hypothetical protein